MSNKTALSAAVYTELSDVEGEINGFMTYDRKIVKVCSWNTCLPRWQPCPSASASSGGQLHQLTRSRRVCVAVHHCAASKPSGRASDDARYGLAPLFAAFLQQMVP